MDLRGIDDILDETDTLRVEGRVRGVVGLGIRAAVPGARIGDLVEIPRRDREPLRAEVVGFSDDEAWLMPLGDTRGLGPDDPVIPIDEPLSVPCSDALLGRVLDGLGRPLDDGPPLEGEARSLLGAPIDPLRRPRIDTPLPVGVRALDAFVTLGEGQRVGIFAGSGVGKSSLLGQIARQAEADVFVVCLVGERGRELRELVEDLSRPGGRRGGLGRGVIVCATSDVPALVRDKSVATATTIAEWFRDQGKRVLLLVDSLTRLVRARREIGLAAGEPPARRGYPPSAFSTLPQLLERAGRSSRGSITALYTVLVEGDDLEEPVADETRGLLDGHVVLDRHRAARGHFPPVDVLHSVSRAMGAVTDDHHRAAARAVRALIATYETKRDLITLGAYRAGSDPEVDRAIARIDAIEHFLAQAPTEEARFEDTLSALKELGR